MAKKIRQQSHQIRIISGQWRGKKIAVVDQDGLRPTTDRVRETLFNWLALPIVNAVCLDAFAGSGVLGFEALSRDAKSVVAVESAKVACNAIKKNALSLNATEFNLIEQDTLHYMMNGTEPFDVVFLDPPFAQPKLLASSLSLIIKNKLLQSDGLIYIECAKMDLHHLNEFEPQINWLKKKTAGQVCYALLSLTEQN